MTDHELYEVLCTLAATGQLAAAEKANFDDHCLHCAACREQLQDLISVGVQLRLDAAMHAISSPMPAGSLERFCARAVREGVALRYVPTRPSLWYALGSAVAVFVMVAGLVFMPHGGKSAEGHAISTAAPIPARRSLLASVSSRTPISQPSKAAHVHFVRRGLVPHTGVGVNDASLTAERFPRAITASYPLFGPPSATESSSTSYPALSLSQISRFDLFPDLDGLNHRNLVGIATPGHPIDIASTGHIFDFAANLRQLHFQVPTSQ